MQDTIASRYICESLIITYLMYLLCSGFCVLFVIQSAPKFD